MQNSSDTISLQFTLSYPKFLLYIIVLSAFPFADDTRTIERPILTVWVPCLSRDATLLGERWILEVEVMIVQAINGNCLSIPLWRPMSPFKWVTGDLSGRAAGHIFSKWSLSQFQWRSYLACWK
ncbi:hypothetical protein PoB_003349600 [Plakobranchus ocellatus]|uniref:Uncharacterized protein n=1 Tax=Plakobranchus ocellatus TaxID=259542 RepID=A0AAV4AK62_9GAST|nr:hypothetical protein PoB_003349600 [Plakobranchus ocellatus]